MGYGDSGNNGFDKLLKFQLDKNNSLKEHLNIIIKLIERGNSLDTVEKDEILNFFEPWVGYEISGSSVINTKKINNNDFSQMKIIFQKLELEHKEITEMLKKMIVIGDNENKLISDFLNQKSFSKMERETLVEKIKVNYQAEKIRLWEQLRLKFGETSKFEEFELNRTEETLLIIVKSAFELYVTLEKLILNKNGKDMRWDAIYKQLLEIEKKLSKITGKYKEEFLTNLKSISDENRNSKNSYQFYLNYFNVHQTFSDFLTYYKEKYESHDIYSNLDEDQKKKIDKLLTNSLSILFDKIKNISKILKEQTDKDDEEFKKLKNEYKSTFVALNNYLSVDNKKFKGPLIDCSISGLSRVKEGKISLKDFEIKYLKASKENKVIIEEIIQRLKQVLSGNDKRKFEEDNIIYFNKTNFSSGGFSDNLDENEIKKIKDEFMKKVKAIAIFIKKIKETEDDGNKTQIITDLKNTLQYFLDVKSNEDERKEFYRELFNKGFKNTINDDDIDSIIRISKAIINSNDLDSILTDCIGLLNHFKRLKCFEDINEFIKKV